MKIRRLNTWGISQVEIKKENPFITLGEEGRNRKLEKIPVSFETEPQTDDVILIDNVKITKISKFNKIFIKVLDEPDEDNRCAIITSIPMGYRGSVYYTLTTTHPCPNTGQSITIRCMKCDALAKWEGMSSGEHQNIYDTFNLQVLAVGEHAQGIVGRMGGWEEILILMNPGDSFRISREGRVYGHPREYFVSWNGTTLKNQTKENWELSQSAAEKAEEI